VNEVNVKLLNVILLLSFAVAQQAFAESPAGVVREANKLYRQGQFKEAVDGYDRALQEAPEAIEPRFNKADGYFRLDDLQQAIDLYKAVAAQSRDMQLVAKAKYNLGNSMFEQGVKLAQTDSQKAIESMKSAIGSWRQSLDIDPANEKAAKNIEVARLSIKDILEQIEKQKQQQEQQQQQQKQNQEDLKQLLEQQKALADKTEQAKQQPSPDFNEIAKEQSELKDRTEQMKQELQKQADANKPGQQAAEHLKDATENQKDAKEKLDKSDAQAAKKSQDKAAQDIVKALKSLSEKKEQNQQQQAQQQPNQPQEPNEVPQQQPQEQAEAPDSTAQEILDREQRQKQERQLMQSPAFQKVDKDW